MMRRTYRVHPTHDLKRCSERAFRDRAVRFSALGLPGRKRDLFDIIGEAPEGVSSAA
jgi:hypothetical protein